ncbi:MAG: hypothetical protein P1U34_10110 [Coxiellaceae bacterium]|nr:hypothetical protein [Coxiellaceae bacterium]
MRREVKYRINVIAMAHRRCRDFSETGRYGKWVEALLKCEDITTMQAEVNRQLAYYDGWITGVWYRKSSSYYYLLEQTERDIHDELAYQRRQQQLQSDLLSVKQAELLVEFYCEHWDGFSYGMTELAPQYFNALFMPSSRLTRRYHLSYIAEQLFKVIKQSNNIVKPALKACIANYLYILPIDKLGEAVATELYSDSALEKLFDRVRGELNAGLSMSQRMSYFAILKKINGEELSHHLELRRALLGVRLFLRSELDLLADKDRALIVKWQQKSDDFLRVLDMKVHAYNIGLTQGIAYAEQYDLGINGGLSSWSARHRIVDIFSAYIDSLSEDHSDKSSLVNILHQMNRDADDVPESVPHMPALTPGRVFSLQSGWEKHAISITLCCIEGVTYLAIANKGDGIDDDPGIHIYKVRRPEALSQQVIIAKLHCNTENKAYMLDRAKDGRGIGKDLQLEHLVYMPQSFQRGPRCALISINKEIQCRMVFGEAVAIAKQNKAAGRSPALTADDFTAAYDKVKPDYKQFRAFSRAYSVGKVEPLMRVNEMHIEPGLGRNLVRRANDKLMRDTERYAQRKYGQGSLSEAQRDALLSLVARRQRWNASLLAPKPTDLEGLCHSPATPCHSRESGEPGVDVMGPGSGPG